MFLISLYSDTKNKFFWSNIDVNNRDTFPMVITFENENNYMATKFI